MSPFSQEVAVHIEYHGLMYAQMESHVTLSFNFGLLFLERIERNCINQLVS